MKSLYPRIIGGIVLIGLCIWIHVAGPPKDQSIRDLNRALRSHTVGRLSAIKRKALEATMREMLEALDIRVEVAVDQPYRAKTLNVYTTSREAVNITNCGAGNARYDPILDSIFFDEQFFDDRGYRDIYTASEYGSVVGFNEDLRFPDIFVRFVLLHELGHRQLHRGIVGYLPHLRTRPSEQLRQREREADRYAVEGMQKFYAFDKEHNAGLVGPPLREAVGLSEAFDNDVGPSDQVYVDLVGTLFLMANANLYLPTPYSPFFEDESHPTFLDRAQGAIQAVLEKQTLPPKLRANFLFLGASLRREAGVGRIRFTEVIVPMPVNDVSFAPTEVLIAGRGNSRLFSVQDGVTGVSRQAGARNVVYAVPRGETVDSSGDEPNEGFWSRPDGSALIVDAHGDVWNYTDGRRSASSLPLPNTLTTRDCFRLLTPPQPTDKAVAVACDKSFTRWFVSEGSPQQIVSRKQPELVRELTLRLQQPVGDVEPIGMDDRGLYLGLTGLGTNKERLIGSARLSSSSLAIEYAGAFRSDAILGRDNGSDRVWPLLFAHSSSEERHFILSSQNFQEPSIGMVELFPQASPRMVAQQKLLVSEVPPDVTADLIADFDPYVLNTWRLTTTTSLIYLANDSLYLFNASTMQFEVVFHPTFEGIDVRLGQRGRWAVFMRGGSRVFLFDSRPE